VFPFPKTHGTCIDIERRREVLLRHAGKGTLTQELRRLAEVAASRKPPVYPDPFECVRVARAPGAQMYVNENERLGIEFAVERVNFPACRRWTRGSFESTGPKQRAPQARPRVALRDPRHGHAAFAAN
jgi:hypothetical protein